MSKMQQPVRYVPLTDDQIDALRDYLEYFKDDSAAEELGQYLANIQTHNPNHIDEPRRT